MESIVSAIEEFYTTADPQRRHQLDAKLTKFVLFFLHNFDQFSENYCFYRFQREEKAASWQFALAVLTGRDGSEVILLID